MRRLATAFALLGLCVPVLISGTGCSSSDNNGPRTFSGTLAVQINWPSRSRYVPPYANSIVLELTITQTNEVRTITVNRGPNDDSHTGRVAFPDPIPVGSHLLSMKAYTAADGLGELVAAGNRVVTIVAKRETTVNVSADLNSVIDAVFIDNAPPTVQAGNQITLVGHAEDATGQTLMLPPGALQWSILSGGAFASIEQVTGLFTAQSAGQVTVQLAEPEAGKADTADITIVAPPPPGFGNVAITVDWPGRTRYVPPYANSLVATIGSETITINRSGDAPSQGTAIFPNPFPVSGNPYTLNLEAYTQTNGGGTKVAAASIQITVLDGETLSLNVSGDLESVIDHIVIEGPFTVQVNESVQMIGHAEDASNTIILLPAGALTWSLVSGNSFASITSGGLLQGLAPGVARVRLEEPGAGVFAEADVNIVNPPPPPPTYKVLFTRVELGNSEIYTMTSDGNNKTNVSNSPGIDRTAEFDATGSKIIYASDRDEGTATEIYIMNADGTNRRRLTDSPDDDTDPSLSPDGTRYVFASRRGANWDLYIGETAGLELNIVQITNNPAIEKNPSWSPNGNFIVFTSDVNGNDDLFVYDVMANSVSPLITGPSDDRDGRYSPDGTKILFTSTRDGNAEIYLYDINTTTLTRLTFNVATDEKPVFTHDMQRILFVSDRTGNREVFIMNANGTAATNLTTNSAEDTDPHTPRLP
jgi:Tol biopolymer transport system component